MGISRASVHKRRLTGGKRKPMRKKRKFEMGRPPAMTKLGPKRIRIVRGRGGNLKRRALRLEAGNFSWGTEATTRRTRILGVVYNASNNELVRTNTLVKNSIIQIEATPFRVWYEQHYGVTIGKKKKSLVRKNQRKRRTKIRKNQINKKTRKKILKNQINKKTKILKNQVWLRNQKQVNPKELYQSCIKDNKKGNLNQQLKINFLQDVF